MSGVEKKEWDQAVGKVKEVASSAGEVACHASSAVGAMASRAACDIGKEADHLTAGAGTCIEGLGDRLSRNAPHTGFLGNTSQAVAGAVKESGEYLQSAKLSGMTEDVAHLVRRNPIPAIVIAIGLGWFVGRNLKT